MVAILLARDKTLRQWGKVQTILNCLNTELNILAQSYAQTKNR